MTLRRAVQLRLSFSSCVPFLIPTSFSCDACDVLVLIVFSCDAEVCACCDCAYVACSVVHPLIRQDLERWRGDRHEGGARQ